MKPSFSTKTMFSSGFKGLFYLCIISCVSLLQLDDHETVELNDVSNNSSFSHYLFPNFSRDETNLTVILKPESDHEDVQTNLVPLRKNQVNNSVLRNTLKINSKNKNLSEFYGKSVYSKDNSVLPVINDRNINEKRQNGTKKVSPLLSQITIKTSVKVENAKSTTEENRELTVTESIPASVESDVTDDSQSDGNDDEAAPASASPEKEVTSSSSSETRATAEDTEKAINPEGFTTEGGSSEVSGDEGTIPLRHKCNSTDQCMGRFTECRTGFCKCELGFLPLEDNPEICGDATSHHTQVPRADPTMIGVVIGLVLMSVTMCIVFRLFARARFRENRTIFNTANPRLMNASLAKAKGSKGVSRVNSASGGKSRRESLESADLEAQENGNGTPSDNPSDRRRSRFHKQRSTDTSNSGGRGSGPPSRVMSRNAVRQDSISAPQQY